MMAGALERDTDADWRELGATQPYWGVITHPDYRTENLTPESVEAFYASGLDYVGEMSRRLKQATGKAPGGHALDFGCGAGRLTEAMTGCCTSVVGCDISPGMLEVARARGGKATYAETLPDGPFDWINSFIVFQHIPPKRGLERLKALLDRLAPGGAISLHFTIWREARHETPQPQGWRKLFAPLLELRRPPVAAGTMMMYDYDLSAVVRALNEAGVAELSLVSTDHDGHHGVIVLGRRKAAP